MQDFGKYSYELTVADLVKILAETDENIVVIINGEYYDLKGDEE